MNRTRMRRREGYVIVLLAMLLFGIMAMAALVVDLGFARLAQQQMRVAADSAALEGLRGKGVIVLEDRQQNAEGFIAWHFNDNLDTVNGGPGVSGDGGSFGAGPLVAFSGGAGEASLFASQDLAVDINNSGYRPAVQRGSESRDEFSVDLQRGGVADEMSTLFAQGPPVPYLFARGSLIDRQRVGTGIAVGAQAAGEAGPALSVGLPVLDSSGNRVYPGAVAIGYRLDDWNGDRTAPRQVDLPKTTVGQVVAVGEIATLADGYCCIYGEVDGADRVVGFGMIEGGEALPSFVAVANATGRLSDIWLDLDPAFRDSVRAQNALIQGGLQVAVPRARR